MKTEEVCAFMRMIDLTEHFIVKVSSLKTEEVCALMRMIDLTEHFIVKEKSVLKHHILLLQDVTLGARVLKNPLIGKDQ